MSQLPESAIEREPSIHTVKCWMEPFAAVRSGAKTHEFRKNDRDYRVGDLIVLQEWCEKTEAYTREMVSVRVTHATYGPAFGIPDGYCVLSITLEGDDIPDGQCTVSGTLKAFGHIVDALPKPPTSIHVHASDQCGASVQTIKPTP